MKITFLGHACFLIESKDSTVLTDPFLNDNDGAPCKAEDVNPDVILVSHAHFDHIADAPAIAKRCGASVVAIPEVVGAYFSEEGMNPIPGNLGGIVNIKGGTAKFVPAAHSCGVAGGVAVGFLLELEGKKIYFAGDTALISDMALLESEHIDCALLPIGSVYTMAPEDALKAIGMIKPAAVIPMHYSTWPPIAQDGAAFAARAKEEYGVNAVALEPGQSMEI